MGGRGKINPTPDLIDGRVNRYSARIAMVSSAAPHGAVQDQSRSSCYSSPWYSRNSIAFSIFHSPDVHLRKWCGNLVSLRLDGDQRDDEVVISKYVVHVDAERASWKFHRASKESSDLLVACEIPWYWTMPGNVPVIAGSNAANTKATFSCAKSS
jgi:hypothetical protein